MQLKVTATKLNKRKNIPSSLPDAASIVGVVNKGYAFSGDVIKDPPNPVLGDWYVDRDGYYYWGNALMIVDEPEQEKSTAIVASALKSEQIAAATGASMVNADKFSTYINDTCNKYQINTPARKLCFLAQLGHESGGLYYTEELASGKAYEGRRALGNTQAGDGVRYKGRGLIQITGRANYQSLSHDLGQDFINLPDLLGGRNVTVCSPDQLLYAALSAGWFWNRANLNVFADAINIKQDIDDGNNLVAFKAITRKINGGYNGLSDRVKRYRGGVGLF